MDKPTVLYHKFVYHQECQTEVEWHWGKVPKSYGEAVELARDLELGDYDRLEQLIGILRDYHKKLGIYTQKVESNLCKLKNGAIVSGQQPVVLGGPSFIGNKLACTAALSKFSGDEFPPLYFFADYDGTQKELAKSYLPNAQSPKPHHIEFEFEREDVAIHAVKQDPTEWLEDQLEKIRLNYNEFSALLGERRQQKLLKERMDHIFNLIRGNYYGSTSFAEPILKLWGFLANHVADLGVIFFPASLPAIRELLAEGYGHLITHRTEFVNGLNNATDRLVKMGLKPGMGCRKPDYLPFYYECPGGEGHTRVRMTSEEKDGELWASGVCSHCEHVVYIRIGKHGEHLAENARYLSPRVDTSQLVLQHLLPVRIRVGGPGEISYYAQVIPAARSIGITLPVFVRYTRVFYNAPWIESLCKTLNDSNPCGLHQREFFKLLGTLAKARRKNQMEVIAQTVHDIAEFIEATSDHLANNSETEDHKLYSSWQFGMFELGKFGQEVSWSWIDMALQTGIDDYIATYSRYYAPSAPPGGMAYINTLTL